MGKPYRNGGGAALSAVSPEWTNKATCPNCGKKGWCIACPEGTGCRCKRPNSGGNFGHLAEAGEDACGPYELRFAEPPRAPEESKPKRQRKPKPKRGTSGELDRVYSRLLELCPLTVDHKNNLLTKRLLTEQQVKTHRFASLPDGSKLRDLTDALTREFGDSLLRVPGFRLGRTGAIEIVAAGSGLLIPYLDGETISAVRLRLDDPGEGGSYRWLSGGGGPSAETAVYLVAGGQDNHTTITEGEFKAWACADHFDSLAIGLPGAGSIKLALPVLDKLKSNRVRLALDSDHQTNKNVLTAARNAVKTLRSEGKDITFLLWPQTSKGIDDAIQDGAELKELRGDEIDAHLSATAKALGADPDPAESQATEQPPTELEAILEPLAELEEGYKGAELQTALKTVAKSAPGLEPLDRAMLESEAMRHLKRIKAPKPADLLKATIGKDGDEKSEPKGLALTATIPWETSVDGREVMAEQEAVLRKYISLPDGALEAIALWLVFTFAVRLFQVSPRLALRSPTKRCGKTTTMALISALAEKPLPSSSISPAALFRSIEHYGPTVIADEADTWINDNEDLRGVLNSGFFRATAQVIRCAGDDHEVKIFNTFGAMALAGIGKFPDTVHDRSLSIEMQRNIAPVTPLRLDRLPLETEPIRRKLARWVADHEEDLCSADPIVPERLHSRAADCWRPLLAIADNIGGDWPARARKAAVTLSGGAELADEDIGTMLLSDIRKVFTTRQVHRLPTETILACLHDMEERPWGEWRKGKPMSPRALAGRLRSFGIAPNTVRTHIGRLKGYELESFGDAFDRYLSPLTDEKNVTEEDEETFFPSQGGVLSVTTGQPNNDKGLRSNPIRDTHPSVTDRETEETAPLLGCHAVTDRNGGNVEKKTSEAENATSDPLEDLGERLPL